MGRVVQMRVVQMDVLCDTHGDFIENRIDGVSATDRSDPDADGKEDGGASSVQVTENTKGGRIGGGPGEQERQRRSW